MMPIELWQLRESCRKTFEVSSPLDSGIDHVRETYWRIDREIERRLLESAKRSL
jgi:hypothetical protein